jgi:hypothetical protein
MCFLLKIYEIVSSTSVPIMHLGRKASKMLINKLKPRSPIRLDYMYIHTLEFISNVYLFVSRYNMEVDILTVGNFDVNKRTQ